jgi:hypothetical protein
MNNKTAAPPAVETKFFEVRDEGTCIPVIVTRFVVEHMDGRPLRLVRRGGWGTEQVGYYLTVLSDCRTAYDPYQWAHGRTLGRAHMHIKEHWDNLHNGEMIDVCEIVDGISSTTDI